jgi:hypothetical protein
MNNVDGPVEAQMKLSAYPERPIAELNAMHNLLAPLGTPCTFLEGEAIHASGGGEQAIYLFSEGMFRFVRTLDALTLSTTYAPMIYGLGEAVLPRGSWYLVAQSACKGYKIPANVALEAITKHQQWQAVATIFAWFLQVFSARDEQLVGVNSYTMIRNKLVELGDMSIEMRRDINVADYIQQRTQLARSTIMTILGELRKGEYIEIRRGRLLGIRHLPKDY